MAFARSAARFALPFAILTLTTSLAAQQTTAQPTTARPAAKPARRVDLAAFDAYVAQAVRDWKVPGLAVAIVQGDSIVFEKGYGTRTLGRDEPVDEHTVFAVGSTTKAFTVATLLMLADSGRVELDAPVRTYLPAFELRDPVVTRELTVRDLLTHRSGVANDDFLWVLGYPRAEVIRRMRWLPQASSPRSTYAYNNLSYVVAGEVAAAVAGRPWNELVRTRILQPLGMNETVTGFGELRGRPNVASAHLRVNDSTLVIPERDIDNAAPAGSIHSSVHDMARWLAFLMDSARAGGRQLISPSALGEMFTPQFVVPLRDFYPAARLSGTHFANYGLGWFLQDYRGRFVAMHTGSIDGMSAIAGIVPEERVAVVVLVNLDHAELRHALLYRVFDLYTGQTERDWSSELRALYTNAAARGRAAFAERLQQRVRGTRPTLALDRYAGVYNDTVYGDLRVRVEGGKLVGSLANQTIDLEHWNYDTFRMHFREPGDQGESFLTFGVGPDGTVQTATIEGLRPFNRVDAEKRE